MSFHQAAKRVAATALAISTIFSFRAGAQIRPEFLVTESKMPRNALSHAAQKLLDTSDGAYAKKDYPTALRSLEGAADADSNASQICSIKFMDIYVEYRDSISYGKRDETLLGISTQIAKSLRRLEGVYPNDAALLVQEANLQLFRDYRTAGGELYGDALRLYSAAIALDTNNWQAYYGRATTYSFMKGYRDPYADTTPLFEASQKDFERAFKLNPRNPYILIEKSRKSTEDLWNYKTAIADLKRSISIKPTHEAYELLGDAYWHHSRFSLAANAYLKAARNPAEKGENYASAGDCYYELKEYKKALNAYGKAMRSGGFGPTLHAEFGLAKVYFAIGKLEEAYAHYTETNGFYRTDGATLGVNLMFALHRYSEFVRMIFEEDVWENEEIRDALKGTALSVGSGSIYFPEAIEHYTKKTVENPTNDTLFFKLGHIQFYSGKMDSAAASLEMALKLNPKNLDAGRFLPYAYYRAGNYAKAAEKFNVYLALKDDGHAWICLAVTFGKLGMHEQVIYAAKRAGKSDENFESKRIYNPFCGCAHRTNYGYNLLSKNNNDLNLIYSPLTSAHEFMARRFVENGEIDSAISQYGLAISLQYGYMSYTVWGANL